MASNTFLGAGFAALGLLVGTVAGLSSAELTTTLLGLLFALIGGSVIAFIQKLDDASRRAAGVALLAFSLPAMIGLFAGISVRINDLLQFQTPDVQVSRSSADDYLRATGAERIAFLRAQVLRNELTLEEACGAIDKQQE